MRSRGVTLIELLVVLVVVAMLAGIAVPGYRGYLLRAHRVEAKAALLRLAAAQQKFHLQNGAYATQAALAGRPPGGLGLAAATADGWYRIAIESADATSFVATATAAGAQTADADCATFSIDAMGRRHAARSDGTASTACWK